MMCNKHRYIDRGMYFHDKFIWRYKNRYYFYITSHFFYIKINMRDKTAHEHSPQHKR
jgi:hypothetical protein